VGVGTTAGAGVGAVLGVGSSPAISWITVPEVVDVVGVGVGLGTSSPAAVRIMGDTVLELDGKLFSLNEGILEEDEAGGWPSVRKFLRMLLASLGDIVVVVVVVRGLANTVTVTVAGSSTPPSSGPDPDNGVGEGDTSDDDVLDDTGRDVGKEERSSEPVMPPSTPAASIRRRTLFSVVQSSCVPGARISGMAKHS